MKKPQDLRLTRKDSDLTVLTSYVMSLNQHTHTDNNTTFVLSYSFFEFTFSLLHSVAISEFPNDKTLFHLQNIKYIKHLYNLKTRKCKLSEILNISLFAIFQLKNARFL